MSIIHKIAEKREYVSPVIEQVLLDNEISLALESNPANGPNEGAQNFIGSEFLKDNPFRSYNS